jgi:formylglycine-generating enzyme required for sulfatase activity
MVMVFVPAGEFIMGSDNGSSIEKPAHKVYLDAFWIDQTEVTNAMYEKCVQAGLCTPLNDALNSSSYSHKNYYGNPEFDNYPVIVLGGWAQAKYYCELVGRRLPTEAEWEKAARGTDGRTYPWGEGIDCKRANYSGSCVGDTSPVRSYEDGKSPYGAYDMIGNMWEFVSDWYSDTYYLNSPLSNPTGPATGSLHIMRGGAWNSYGTFARTFARNKLLSIWSIAAGKGFGIRCASSQ